MSRNVAVVLVLVMLGFVCGVGCTSMPGGRYLPAALEAETARCDGKSPNT